MKRRTFLQTAAVLTGASMLPSRQLLASILFEAGEMHPLRRNVGFYTERGGTIGWLLTKDHLVVVDTQFRPQAENLLSLLRETNEHPLDLLVNTHHHRDHTSGNIAFKGIVKVHVAHKNSYLNQKRVAEERNNLANELLPDTTFEGEKWSTTVGDETITLHYAGPAHTNGDAMVHFENANVVHMGDLVFNRRFPYIDKSAGAHIGNWVKVLQKARKLFDDEALFIFGHSDNGYPVQGGKNDLMAFENYLSKLLDFMHKAVKEGKTLDELKASVTEIPGAPEWKGDGISRSLDAAWMEVVEGK